MLLFADCFIFIYFLSYFYQLLFIYAPSGAGLSFLHGLSQVS